MWEITVRLRIQIWEITLFDDTDLLGNYSVFEDTNLLGHYSLSLVPSSARIIFDCKKHAWQ